VNLINSIIENYFRTLLDINSYFRLTLIIFDLKKLFWINKIENKVNTVNEKFISDIN